MFRDPRISIRRNIAELYSKGAILLAQRETGSSGYSRLKEGLNPHSRSGHSAGHCPSQPNVTLTPTLLPQYFVVQDDSAATTYDLTPGEVINIISPVSHIQTQGWESRPWMLSLKLGVASKECWWTSSFSFSPWIYYLFFFLNASL